MLENEFNFQQKGNCLKSDRGNAWPGEAQLLFQQGLQLGWITQTEAAKLLRTASSTSGGDAWEFETIYPTLVIKRWTKLVLIILQIIKTCCKCPLPSEDLFIWLIVYLTLYQQNINNT